MEPSPRETPICTNLIGRFLTNESLRSVRATTGLSAEQIYTMLHIHFCTTAIAVDVENQVPRFAEAER
jgi:hypothetical protein